MNDTGHLVRISQKNKICSVYISNVRREMRTNEKMYASVGKSIPMKMTTRGGMMVGGYVPLLRHSMSSVELGDIEGAGINSNKIVGIVAPAPSKKSLKSDEAKLKPTVFQGGELLNRIAIPQNRKIPARENIKFIF